MASKLRAGTVAALLLLAGSVTVASATSSRRLDSGLGSAQHKGPSGSDGHRTVILHLRSEPNRPLTGVDLGEPGFSEADQYVFANDRFSGDTKGQRRRRRMYRHPRRRGRREHPLLHKHPLAARGPDQHRRTRQLRRRRGVQPGSVLFRHYGRHGQVQDSPRRGQARGTRLDPAA